MILGAGIIAIILGAVTTLGNTRGPEQHRGLPDQRRCRLVPDRGGLRDAGARGIPDHLDKLERRGALWRLVVAIVGVATPVLAYYGSLHPFPPYPGDLSLIIAGGFAVLVAVWYLYLQSAHPDRVANAARHASQHHGVPPLDENLSYQPEPGLRHAASLTLAPLRRH